MNALFGVGAISGVLYGIFVDGTYFKIFFAVLAFYTIVFNNLLVNKKQTTKRKNIMGTTWGAPNDPTSYIVVDYDVTKALPYIKKLNDSQKEAKITVTHLISKGMAVGIHRIRRDMGRIKWGYF